MIRKQFWTILVLACLTVVLSAGSVFAASSQITQDLKGTIDRVIQIVGDEKFKNNKEARRKALRETINERFNYHQMVMRSLAKNWNARSDQEREDFIDLFKRLLENSYASKLESYSDEKIKYIDEIVKGKYALVRTEVVRSDSTIAVDYKLIKENGGWKVYDFVIEGVSMIRNYRSQFTKIIRKDSYEVLVRKLTDKINELESEENSRTSEKL
ncbi:toluene tolerance protein [Candidatus Nitromaritima sp. SCGC AAA799-C22]|nr:toluene tolerance protein [Candidatus Nitromaritima sp. SCGC AAA799-C22]